MANICMIMFAREGEITSKPYCIFQLGAAWGGLVGVIQFHIIKMKSPYTAKKTAQNYSTPSFAKTL